MERFSAKTARFCFQVLKDFQHNKLLKQETTTNPGRGRWSDFHSCQVWHNTEKNILPEGFNSNFELTAKEKLENMSIRRIQFKE